MKAVKAVAALHSPQPRSMARVRPGFMAEWAQKANRKETEFTEGRLTSLSNRVGVGKRVSKPRDILVQRYLWLFS